MAGFKTPSTPKDQAPTGPLAGLKALVIEDDALIAQALQNTLEQAGAAAVALYDSVSEAIGELRDAGPDIIILDSQVSDRSDGWAVAELVQQLSLKKCAILFATGSPEAVPPHVAALGAVVEKPYTPEQIIGAIMALLD